MSAVDTRNLTRDSLFLMARVRIEGGEMERRIKVRNLSPGGMMAEGDVEVRRGTRIAVELRNIGWVNGTVAWTQGNRAGIAFAEEIDPKLARASVNTSGDIDTPRFVRPSSILPPEERSDKSRLRKL